MDKIKVCIPYSCKITYKMLEEEFELVDNLNEADFYICWSTVPNEILDKLDRVILLQYEPPLSSHRIWTYGNFDKFHTVFSYDPKGGNEIEISRNPLSYPVNPAFDYDVRREDTTLTKRGIFYAGAKGESYRGSGDYFDGINMKIVRDDVCRYLLENYENTTVRGIGWGDQKTKPEYWRRDKNAEIEESGADFHLCMENCVMKDHVSEKFHDGFGSDRVVFYLGCSNIMDYIPDDIYINLNKWFNTETKEFDTQKIIEVISNITQEEYDGYIQRAREWRDQLPRKDYIKQQDNLTQTIINRIKETKKND